MRFHIYGITTLRFVFYLMRNFYLFKISIINHIIIELESLKIIKNYITSNLLTKYDLRSINKI